MESTLRNVAMKPRRLSVNVDQPIVLARNDNNWHPEVAVSFAQGILRTLLGGGSSMNPYSSIVVQGRHLSGRQDG